MCANSAIEESSTMCSLVKLRIKAGDLSRSLDVQSCVETFLLSSEDHSQNVPLPTPNMHYGATFQPTIPEQEFLHDSVAVPFALSVPLRVHVPQNIQRNHAMFAQVKCVFLSSSRFFLASHSAAVNQITRAYLLPDCHPVDPNGRPQIFTRIPNKRRILQCGTCTADPHF